MLVWAALVIASHAGEKMKLESSAFVEGKAIPVKYTCDGANISPPLRWSNTPAAAKGYVLIVDDPDAPAGTWVHWLLYDVPASVREIPEGAASSLGVQGKNDFGRSGYGGPCPPPGKAHRYFFKLYALDARLGLKPGARKNDLESAISGHIMAEAELMGTYERRSR